MNETLISVLMPSFNHAQYINVAIESIWRQNYSNIEIIIIDDASTDESLDVLNLLKIKSPVPMQVCSNERNYGPSFSLAKAFELSKGEFIAFLASDDIYAPLRFSEQVKRMNENKNIMISFADGLIMQQDGSFGKKIHGKNVKMLLEQSAKDILTYLYTHTNPFFIQTALVRRTLMSDCFDKDSIADDWVINIKLFSKLIENGECDFVNQVVFYYRQHSENIHKNINRHIALQKQVIERYTPTDLKNKAKSNIYWQIGRSLLLKQPFRAIYYILKSRLCYFLHTINPS